MIGKFLSKNKERQIARSNFLYSATRLSISWVFLDDRYPVKLFTKNARKIFLYHSLKLLNSNSIRFCFVHFPGKILFMIHIIHGTNIINFKLEGSTVSISEGDTKICNSVNLKTVLFILNSTLESFVESRDWNLKF